MFYRTSRVTLLSCAIALVLNGVAQSAEQGAPQELTKIKVQAEETAGATYTAESTATATGLLLSPRETPQSVSVVTRERMDDQAMTTVGDALRNTTGVSLKPVDRGRNNISVRGFDVNNFQLDGIPVATGNIGLETSNAVLYDRIEVVRGATGLLSGAGDPSAAVNMVRKHADSAVPTGDFTVEIGSWDQRTGTVDLSTPLNREGTVRARVVASANEQDSFVDLENTDYSVFYAVMDADLTDNTRLSVGASQQRNRRNGVLWAGLPYWYADGTRTDYSRSSTTAARWNRWDTTDRNVFASLQHSFDNRWTVRGDVSYHDQEEDSTLLWLWGDPDRTTGEGMSALPYYYIADPQQTHADIVVSGPFSLFGREHEMTAGIMHSRLNDGWSNRDSDSGIIAIDDFNAWDGSLVEPTAGERYRGSRGRTTQTAFYAVARLQLLEALKFIGGARWSDWRREEEEGAWTAAAYEIDHSGLVTPYAGLIYDIGEYVSLYASYTDSFKPDTKRDRNGNYLDPLQGNSYETGIKGELLDSRLNVSAAIFRIEQDNFAVPDVGFFVPGTTEPASRSSQGVTSEGYELEATGELAPGWHLSLGWTHYSAKDANDVDVAVDHARQQLKLFTRYSMQGRWQGLSVGGGFNWEGDRPARAVNPATGEEEKVGQPAYGLLDLMAKYDFEMPLSLQLNVNNALDKKYRSSSYWWGAPYTYGEPREVLLTVRYGF